MNIETLVAFSTVAGLAIASPGPAILLALRNGITSGLRAVVWSSLGNITGLFCLSAAAMLGLGLLLQSSAVLFGLIKILGALYLFYIGIRHLLGGSWLLDEKTAQAAQEKARAPYKLYREGLFLAASNPKAILFFTALFPQFIDAREALLPQFLILTSLFMVLSFTALLTYAAIATRAKSALLRPGFATWFNRVAGAAFISFAALLLTLRRPVT